MLRLEFPWAFEGANRSLRTNRWQRTKARTSLAWDVWAQLAAQGVRRPVVPIEFAYVYVRRFSARSLDPDNLPSCAKHLLDVLQPVSATHPSGLGIIRQDNAKHLHLDVAQMQIGTKGKPRTVVLIASRCLDVSCIEGQCRP